MAGISYGRVLARLAERDPDRVAVAVGDESITRGGLERRSNRVARAYAELGVREGDFVTIGLPNGIEFFVACLAAWKLGAVPNPVSSRLPPAEREAIVERASPRLIVGGEEAEGGRARDGRASLPAGFEPDPGLPDGPLPDRTPPHERAIRSVPRRSSAPGARSWRPARSTTRRPSARPGRGCSRARWWSRCATSTRRSVLLGSSGTGSTAPSSCRP